MAILDAAESSGFSTGPVAFTSRPSTDIQTLEAFFPTGLQGEGRRPSPSEMTSKLPSDIVVGEIVLRSRQTITAEDGVLGEGDRE